MADFIKKQVKQKCKFYKEQNIAQNEAIVQKNANCIKIEIHIINSSVFCSNLQTINVNKSNKKRRKSWQKAWDCILKTT